MLRFLQAPKHHQKLASLALVYAKTIYYLHVKLLSLFANPKHTQPCKYLILTTPLTQITYINVSRHTH